MRQESQWMQTGSGSDRLAPAGRGQTKTIPFDYAFTFQLSGQSGAKVQDVVPISVEGVFVATAIGYSLVLDEAVTPRFVQPEPDPLKPPQDPVGFPFFQLFPENIVLATGMVVSSTPGSQAAILGDSLEILAQGTIGADGIGLLGFGEPKSDTVARVWDRTSNRLSAPLQIGSLSTPVIGPDPISKALPSPQEGGAERISIYGSGGDDFQLFLIDGRAGQVHRLRSGTMRDETVFGQPVFRSEISLEIPDIGNVRLAAGDVLLVRGTDSSFKIAGSSYAVPRPQPSTITLGAISRGLERLGTDLTAGFRLNPTFVDRFNADIPLDKINPDARRQLFQTGCSAAQEVSFLYSIDVLGSGRELQNKAIHNIAGLGIGNGDRPFRPLAKPFAIAPRSSVRIQIEELSGPAGKLYIVLHGYKMLGQKGIPA